MSNQGREPLGQASHVITTIQCHLRVVASKEKDTNSGVHEGGCLRGKLAWGFCLPAWLPEGRGELIRHTYHPPSTRVSPVARLCFIAHIGVFWEDLSAV